MYTLTVENKKTETLKLTQNESEYQVVEVKGLEPPKANIYTNTIANMDGQRFKSSKLEMRNVVISIKLNGDVERNRINLYKFFGVGKWSKLYYYNGSRKVYIEGYCENIECSLFEINQTMQISIVCPNPYFQSIDKMTVDFSNVSGEFTFPFTINESGVVMSTLIYNNVCEVLNDGEFETGLKIKLRALADNVSDIVIYNYNNGEYLALNDITLNNGDVIKINTSKGSKSIILISNGEEHNIINYLQNGSNWLQLETGINQFTYEAINGNNLQVVFEYNHQYEGV